MEINVTMSSRRSAH